MIRYLHSSFDEFVDSLDKLCALLLRLMPSEGPELGSDVILWLKSAAISVILRTVGNCV